MSVTPGLERGWSETNGSQKPYGQDSHNGDLHGQWRTHLHPSFALLDCVTSCPSLLPSWLPCLDGLDLFLKREPSNPFILSAMSKGRNRANVTALCDNPGVCDITLPTSQFLSKGNLPRVISFSGLYSSSVKVESEDVKQGPRRHQGDDRGDSFWELVRSSQIAVCGQVLFMCIHAVVWSMGLFIYTIGTNQYWRIWWSITLVELGPCCGEWWRRKIVIA